MPGSKPVKLYLPAGSVVVCATISSVNADKMGNGVRSLSKATASATGSPFAAFTTCPMSEPVAEGGATTDWRAKFTVVVALAGAATLPWGGGWEAGGGGRR